MGLSPGTRLGPYEILSPLGAGGMGEVWKARDTRVERDVALKVLPKDFLESKEGGERRERFEREARLLASLSHPNVATLYSFEEIPGPPPRHILTMELLEGEPLRGKLSSPLPPKRAVEIAVQIAHGLAAAHEKGIVHRDLKPENVFVTRDGQVKLLDFGIAKLTQPTISSVSATEAPTETPATGAGVVLGTVGYMSPEQVLGRPLDARSDLFSLGVVLYEMLAGKRPFHKETAPETMAAILREEPPDLADSGRNVPPGLERIVRHCLEKEPAARFQSARDVAFALEALTGTSTSAQALTPPRIRTSKLLLAGFALAALAAAVPFSFLAGKRAARPEPPVFKRLTYQRGWVGSARFAPDERTVLYTASSQGGPNAIYSWRPESPDAVRVDLPTAGLLAISRSGELAIRLEGGTLARAPLTGGTPRQVAENVNEAAWGPDDRLLVKRPGGVGDRLEYPLGTVVYESTGAVSSPHLSPRGDVVAFAEHPVRGDSRGSIAIVNLKGKREHLTRELNDIRGVAWSPAGDEVWFAASIAGESHSLWGVSLGGRIRAIARVPGMIQLKDVSRSGRVLATRPGAFQAVKWLAPGDRRERDLTWLGGTYVFDLSRDGRTIVTQEQAEALGNDYAVCLWRMDGTPVRIAAGYAGSLSPDGKWLVSYPVPDLLPVLHPTGPGESRKLDTRGLASAGDVTWFPDGKRVLVSGSEGTAKPRFFVQDLAGGKPRAVTPEGVVGPAAISPDGSRAAVQGPDGRIVLYPVDGGEPRPVDGALPGDRPMQWSADGRWLWIQERPPKHFSPARIFRIDTVKATRVFWKELSPEDPAAHVMSPFVYVTPDGSSYAYCYEPDLSDLYLIDGLK